MEPFYIFFPFENKFPATSLVLKNPETLFCGEAPEMF